jgi:predicted small integral membrane protein
MANPAHTPARAPTVDLDAADEEAQAAVRRKRTGFLPIQTNWFDRLFISIYIAVALELFWMRFLEPNGIPLWLCHIVVIALGVVIVRRG